MLQHSKKPLTVTSILDTPSKLSYFRSSQVGLPDGIENFKDATSLEIFGKMMHWNLMLQDLQPDCIYNKRYDLSLDYWISCETKHSKDLVLQFKPILQQCKLFFEKV